LGRYISKDPIGFYGGEHTLFVYALNNPSVNKDCYGLFWSPIGYAGALTGAVGASFLFIGTSPFWATSLMVVGGGLIVYDWYISVVKEPNRIAHEVKDKVVDQYFKRLEKVIECP